MSSYGNSSHGDAIGWLVLIPLVVGAVLVAAWQQPELRPAVYMALGAVVLVAAIVAILIVRSGANSEREVNR